MTLFQAKHFEDHTTNEKENELYKNEKATREVEKSTKGKEVERPQVPKNKRRIIFLLKSIKNNKRISLRNSRTWSRLYTSMFHLLKLCLKWLYMLDF